MRKLEILLTMVIIGSLMVLAALNYSNLSNIYLFLVMAFLINYVLNGRKYINKTYFAVIILILAELTLISAYNSFQPFSIGIYLIILITMFHDYRYRDNNPKRPWKNEW